MDAVIVVCGAVFVAMAVFGLVGRAVSPKRRRMFELSGTAWADQIVAAVAGLLILAAGIWQASWLVVPAMALILVVAAAGRRRRRDLADPPPMIARMDTWPLNPLSAVIHPIESARRQASVFRIGRNRAELAEWKRRHDL